MNPISIKPLEIKPINIKKSENLLPTRYCIPKELSEISNEFVKYENAEKLAIDLIFDEWKTVHVIVDGTFIFGDFIEAFIVQNDFGIKKMTISTLSMSNENVDSLANLLDGGYVEKLDLIVSGFHYSQKRNSIVKYTYEVLDKDDRFQMAVADCHTKICCFETDCGKFITIKGSANLSSSGCIEEFSIYTTKDIFQFTDEYHSLIVEKYGTIKKHLRGNELWRTITGTDRIKKQRKK